MASHPNQSEESATLLTPKYQLLVRPQHLHVGVQVALVVLRSTHHFCMNFAAVVHMEAPGVCSFEGRTSIALYETRVFNCCSSSWKRAGRLNETGS